MASIEKRGNKYRARVRIKGVDYSENFIRHADAKAWAAHMESQILDGIQNNAPRNLFFSDVLERYIKEIVPQREGSKFETLRIQNFMKTNLAKVPLTELRPTHFANWRDDRLKSVSPDTVLRELGILSGICNVAMKEWGLLPDNPIKKISKPKGAPPRKRRPTEEELNAIAEKLGYTDESKLDTVHARIGAMVWFAVFTAMRSGEMCSLTWQHIDFEKRLAHLPKTKNGHSRDVPLSTAAIAILEKLRGIHETSVFDVQDATRDVLFRKARDECGIKDLHFHDLRREALTRMSKKVPVELLAKISGHRDLKILLNTYYAPDMADVASMLD